MKKTYKPKPKKVAEPIGCIGLIQQLEDGRIVQIGLSQAQNILLQSFLASISQDRPLVKMSEALDVVLKSDVKLMRRRK